MGEKTQEKKQKSGAGARFLDILAALALLAGVGYGGYYLVQQRVEINQETNYIAETEPTTEAAPESRIIFENTEIQNSEIYNGSLILVNNQTEFQGTEDDLVSLYEFMLAQEQSIKSFGVRDGEVKVRQTNAENLIRLFEAFCAETGDDNIVVQSGYRSKERQEELYNQDLESTGLDYSEKVSKPGFSEHQTGWSVDLTLAEGEYDGTGVYDWIDQHCYEYGMILRYPENKTDITGITYEPWHYRYVGRGHAYYMMQNDLCLEEYMELIRNYPYDGEHLQITDYDGKLYEVFWYPADTANQTTMLPVPGGLDYTISGNNTDGFIVTVDTGEFSENLENPNNPENPENSGDSENPENPDSSDIPDSPDNLEIPDAPV
ncbi:MAG: M15 family metallopeptidase [Oscillospiraceae bacterium]|nr:M15 family metallopeptidase [Oscillospiraceae bacterium]